MAALLALLFFPVLAFQSRTTPTSTPRRFALTSALATSGDHWHVFTQGGRRYSHTIDPRTGQPVAHALTSITVFHAACMHADALATVLTVLGPQAPRTLPRSYERPPAQAPPLA